MMVSFDVPRARAAVQFLVDSSYFVHHVTKLRSTIEKPRAMPFKGDAEPLNELVRLGRQDRVALDKLVELAEYKRSGRVAYQQQYMAAKRQRERKVITLEELLTGRKLTLDERHNVLVKQYDMWHRERERFIKEHDGSWIERNEALKEFWAAREGELDALIVEARRTLDQTVARKRVVTVERLPKTAFGSKLKDAVGERKKLTIKRGDACSDRGPTVASPSSKPVRGSTTN